MNDTLLGKFKVLEENSQHFRFTSNAGEFIIDGVNSKITIITDEKEETILLDEILRLEYGTMTYQLPPSDWKKLWLLNFGGLVLMELLGGSRDEEKWFQVSAILRSGESIPLYLAQHLVNISDQQIDVAHQIKDAFSKRGRSLDISQANRIAEDEIPQHLKPSQIQPRLQINKRELVKWVAFNFAGLILAGVFTLGIGGGLFVASFQWLLMRQYLPRMRGIIWIGAGLVSSVTTLGTVGPISLLMFAESLRTSDRFTSIIMLLAGHLFFLSLAQVFIWPLMESGNFKKGVIWGVVNSVTVVLFFLGSFFPISIIETNTAVAILSEIIILTLAFVPSGYLFARNFSEKQQLIIYT